MDAAELDAVADVDAGRADRDALMAVDAVAGRLALARAASAFFTDMRGSPRSQLIGDVERPSSVSAAWMRGHGHM